jgi:hypothetical protein
MLFEHILNIVYRQNKSLTLMQIEYRLRIYFCLPTFDLKYN